VSGTDNVTAPGDLTFRYRLDGGAWTDVSGATITLTGLSEGPHTLQVQAVDAAGNLDGSPSEYTRTVQDTTAPQTTIPAAPAASTPETTASFTFAASEAGASFAYRLDGGPWTPVTGSTVTLTALAIGQHTLEVRATDAAGNTDGTPATHTWTVVPPPDTTAPETSIGTAPAATTTATTATFAFTSSEAGGTFRCSLDGPTFTPCTSPTQLSEAVGQHTFRVQAVDAAGNADGTPASHTWTVQSACTPSTVTLGASADAWVLQSSASSNYGTDSVLKIDTKNGANARALVRFTLPAVPAGCQVTSARLRLYNTSPKSGRTMQVFRAGATWAEGTVRWSTQPAVAGTAVTAVTPSNANWMEWTVTDHVRAMYPTSGNFGFVVRDATENGNGIEQQFHSREKAPDRPPQLVVIFG
jgi:large repetitive protein